MTSDVDQTSVIPKPTSSWTAHQTSSSTLGTGTRSIPSLAPKVKSGTSSHMVVLIVVATVPSIFLGIIIGLLICRRRGLNRHKNSHYSIKVEYRDDVRHRRKRSNSRLDLAYHGIHIDLEFPNSQDCRDSVRFSRATHLSESQMRELQFLSRECNEKLEWLNEVLAKEVETTFSGADGGYWPRDSIYSEKEKENFEPSEKILRRESSKRSRDNFKLMRLISRDKDSSGESKEDEKKESDLKKLPKAIELPEKTLKGKHGKGVERSNSKKEVKLPPEGDDKSQETEEENESKISKVVVDLTSRNKTRYYPLARTRQESTRSRLETL